MTSRERLFAVVDKLLVLLPKETGFEPCSFVAFAYGDDDAGENLRRSFRYELDGCCAHVTVDGPRQSPWRRRLVRGFARAGYEPWLSDDESADLRRWLRTASDRRREMQLLAQLGAKGTLNRWPSRLKVARPAPIEQGRWSRAQWARVIDETRASPVNWDDVSICFSRSMTRAAPMTSGSVKITVSVLNDWDPRRGRTIFVFANVSDPGDRRQEAIPARVARAFRRTLRENGFEPDGARSVRGRTIDRRRVGFHRRLTTEISAVRAGKAVFDALVAVRV